MQRGQIARQKAPLTGALLMVGVALTGCASSPQHLAVAGPTSASTTTTAPPTTTTTTTTAPPTTTTTAPPTTTTIPAFTSSVAMVTAAELGNTWRAGCPVDPTQLRSIQLEYWGFDNQPHTGSMVVNASVVDSITTVFSTLYADRFPIDQMVPESAFGGDDNAAAAADDTSGFNCRDAVASGPPQWSMHAYGEAVDVNDVQNPYVDGTTVIPPAGAGFEDRADVRPGMAVAGGELVDAFASVGWQWGGRWAGTPDYQHFSVNGK